MPGIGRFASADTIVPDPANPQSFNRYSYSRNNPINRVDPSGHRDCELDEHCGPPPQTQSLPWDLTEVLVNEMVYHVQSPEMQAIQEGILIDDILDWATLNWTNGLYDMKQTIQDRKGSMIMLCGSAECDWFDYSTPGNIHYGYLAASAGISQVTSDIAGGVLETLTWLEEGTHSGSLRYWGENAEDAEAVRLGAALFYAFGDDLTVVEFQAGLDVFWDDLQRPHPDLIMPALIDPQEESKAYVYYRGALEYHGQ